MVNEHKLVQGERQEGGYAGLVRVMYLLLFGPMVDQVPVGPKEFSSSISLEQ